MRRGLEPSRGRPDASFDKLSSRSASLRPVAGGNALSWPIGERRHSPPSGDTLARAIERLVRFLGTGRYLAVQTVVVVVWIAANVIAGAKGFWDAYPFK